MAFLGNAYSFDCTKSSFSAPFCKWGKQGLDAAELIPMLGEMLLMLLPIWMSIVVGLIVGWSWRPRWVSLLVVALRSRPRLAWSLPPGFGARRLWLAATAAAAAPAVRTLWDSFLSWVKFNFLKLDHSDQHQLNSSVQNFTPAVVDPPVNSVSVSEPTTPIIQDSEIAELCQLLDGNDGPTWNVLMDKEVKGMTYKAWRRDPINGPTEYRSRTVIENCTTRLMRDFFWDDDFRPEWDDMIISSRSLEECERTGCQVVQWIRKFPFFCKDREYVIGRRIFSVGDTYYCITKGVNHPSAPPRPSPRRVDLFYSSWRISPLENGACEVMLIHKEDMGIQRHVAKMGVRQGMWAAVRKIEPGVRAYQALRSSNHHNISRSTSMANLHTPVSPTGGRNLSRRWRSVSDFSMPPYMLSPSIDHIQSSSVLELNSVPEGSQQNEMISENQNESTTTERNTPVGPRGMRTLGVVVFGTCLAAVCGVDKAIICKVLVADLVKRVIGRHMRSRG